MFGFRNSKGLADTLKFISNSGSRKSYYGNGIYVLKLSGNESISTNQHITYTSYKCGIRAICMSVIGSHPLLTLRIIQGIELIYVY